MIEGVKRIAVIGAGTMGHGIAQCFAQAGYQVALMDSERKALDRASALITGSLNAMVQAHVVDQDSVIEIRGRILPTTSIEEAAHDADIAFECVVEDQEVKKTVFGRLDLLCPPRTVLASNTTFLNPFDFVETSRPDKVLIAHWYAPPQIIPLVDVVKGPQTDPASIQLMAQLLRSIGKKPVVFNRFVSGYVVSRLQFALQREVLWLLDNDYLAAEELDDAAKWGLALRMMVVGVVQRIDFGGLDLSARNLEKPSFDPTPLDYMPRKIFDLVKQGFVGVKSGKGFYDYRGRTEAEVCGERDAKLLRMLKFANEVLGS
jgi:3-hydroxybutyryl-CoA dehydrogenase